MRKIQPRACEMKRLYVRSQYRGMGGGKMLAREVINCSRRAGYKVMYLDTIAVMQKAIFLYRSLAFKETEPYYHNPLEGGIYFKLDLEI